VRQPYGSRTSVSVRTPVLKACGGPADVVGVKRIAICCTALLALAAAPAHAERAAGLVPGPGLALFDTASPSSVTIRPITGIGLTERVIGIDKRPHTGQLHAVTVPIGVAANALVKTYSVDPDSGAATFVGSIPSTVPGAADVVSALDFNPAVDRLRVVNVNNENFRINPNNGVLAGDDVNLTFSAPATGPIVAAAYDRNVDHTGAPPTTLYEIDRGSGRLVVQGGIDGAAAGGPNGGVVSSIGPLGVTLDAGSDAGLDISGETGVAYATMRAGSVTRLYTVDLATGAATAVGLLPEVLDIAILSPTPAPPPSPPAPGPTADTTKPAVLLALADRYRLRRALGRGVAFAFSCNETCTASARVASARKTVATGRTTLRAAGVGTLRLKPTRAGVKLLRKARRRHVARVRLALTVTVRDGAGNDRVLKRRILLVR
jgi:hypothetical protein